MPTQFAPPSKSAGSSLAVPAYAITVFVSAFLLFQVQPLMGKFILPWFGGSPSVWTTCMLVFQVLLFGGYAYAHLTSQYLSPRRQILLHGLLLLLAVATLPIAPNPSWKPSSDDWPAARIMLLMTFSVGLPYFLLSSTGPLIQSWFSRTQPGQSPYRLYSLSNVGSLLALLTYPFVFEPVFSVDTQSTLWSFIFGLFAILCMLSSLRLWRFYRPELLSNSREHSTTEATQPSVPSADAPDRPSWNLLGLWALLSMTPSILLLASTNQVCMDVAVIPFLWILPLALYLITFILCFDSDRWYARLPYGAATVISQCAAIYVGVRGAEVPILVQVAVYFAAMFCACMLCHGELAKLKPDPRYLTLYYLTISAGGAAGGLFAGLIAPQIFLFYYELQIGMVCLGVAYICLRMREDQVRLPLPAWSHGLCVSALLVGVVALISFLGGYQEQDSQQISRNFYGVLRVEQVAAKESAEPMLQLTHGRIAHGRQYLAAAKRRVATSYYANSTGIGKLMAGREPDRMQRIGVIGLGVGTLATYGRTGDSFRIYEINPDVIAIAKNRFTFLQDSPAAISIAPGDARLTLEFEEPQDFDVLVLDAFSGDAIPIHLLTREAMQVYLRHLNPDGIVACHISNIHFDLKPVMAGLAAEFGLSLEFIANEAEGEVAAASLWAFFARHPEPLMAFRPAHSESDAPPIGTLVRQPITWTDKSSNLLEVIW